MLVACGYDDGVVPSKDADRTVNSADPDQTSPPGVWDMIPQQGSTKNMNLEHTTVIVLKNC